jgi:hypothetical protein
MKKLALSLLAVALFVSACSSDDDLKIDESPANGFTYNDKNVATPYGYHFNWGSDGNQIAFASHDLSIATLAGKVSAIGIDLDTIINGRTYTYLHPDSSAYNGEKNFAYAYTFLEQPFANGEFDEESVALDSVIGGSVTISKTGDTFYNIAYEIKYTAATIKGEYNGELKNME